MALVVCEVGLRDGLQNEAKTLRPLVRGELLGRLAATGLSRIEAVSFVRADLVPQMGNAEEVLALAPPPQDVTYAGLVLNARGYQRLRNTSCGQVNLAFCVTETFNQRNQGRSISHSLQEAKDVVKSAQAIGLRTAVTLAASFGCPFEGRVDLGRVLALAQEVAIAKPDEIVFADTIGVATPWQVKRMVTSARALGVPLGVHLHNTRNTGYANAYAAIEGGVTTLDASVGGIGGCPFAPHATGNIATEDLLSMLDTEGIDTGIDIDELMRITETLESLLGHQAPGQLHRVGRFAPRPA